MILLDSVRKTFRQDSGVEIVAIDHIDIEIKKGEFLVVIGSNGSGKTTFLNLIAGSIAPDMGLIRIGGTDVTNMPTYNRLEYVSRVFQSPDHGTACGLTLSENLALAELKGKYRWFQKCVSKDDLDRHVRELEELKMDLTNRLNTQISTLSGGQRQAVAVLMATLTRPKIMLLDEHVSSLDPANAKKVMDITERFAKREQITTVMVTHNFTDALTYGDRLIMLHRGTIVVELEREERKKMSLGDLYGRFQEQL